MNGTPARDALDGAITAITAAGCETPRLDAEVLLAHVLGVGRERLLTDRELMVEGPAVRSYQDAVRRRAVEREPVAYIVGYRGFRRLEVGVDRRALVPRPETELLVELGLTLQTGARVLDLGTGDRAEKIRTYNYGERRVTDHRIKLTVHNLDQILEGQLDELTAALQSDEKRRRLETQALA